MGGMGAYMGGLPTQGGMGGIYGEIYPPREAWEAYTGSIYPPREAVGGIYTIIYPPREAVGRHIHQFIPQGVPQE